MNIVDLLDRAGQSWPDVPAIIDGPAGREQVVRYAALVERSRKLACLFAEAGLRAGDGVVIMLPMSAELYAVIAAVWRLCLVPVFMDPAAGEAHFGHCLQRFPVRAFAGTPAACLRRLASRSLRSIPTAFVCGGFFPGARSLRTALQIPRQEDNRSCTADAPAMLAFTSGSTGRPKGVLRTHGLMLATHGVLSTHLSPRPGEVVLATMPVFSLTYLACGATMLIPDVDLRHPGRIDPGRVVSQIEHRRARSAVASPASLERIADHCLLRGQTVESLRKVFVGGAPVFPRLLDKLARIAPHAESWVLYGSTEADPIALISSAQMSPGDAHLTLRGRGLLVGNPIPEISLRILRDRWGSARAGETQETLERDTLKPWQAGEIVVAGPHVAPGYLGGTGDADAKFRLGNQVWHRTGDAGCLDEQNRLWLLGRCAARIDDAQGTLYPYAVEAALSSHPDVRRSALMSHRGERLLVLEIRQGVRLDVQELLAPLGWAGIAAVVLVRQIPVDARHNAKVDYPALKTALDAGRWLRRIEA